MKGYKALNQDMTCRGFQFEVGKTYKHEGEIGLCESGFHFCAKASDCATYYNHGNSVFAEVEATGKIITGDDKSVTNEITILRMLDKSEFYQIANNGKDNFGVCNTGDRNTGDRNTGYRNTGDRNTGNCNTGNCNTGDWNNTNRSTGFFCTEEQTVKIFDMETGKTYRQLYNELPAILWNIPFGNYLQDDKLIPYTPEDRQKFYDGLSVKDQQKIKSMPFFDADKFEKCTGIKVQERWFMKCLKSEIKCV